MVRRMNTNSTVPTRTPLSSAEAQRSGWTQSMTQRWRESRLSIYTTRMVSSLMTVQVTGGSKEHESLLGNTGEGFRITPAVHSTPKGTHRPQGTWANLRKKKGRGHTKDLPSGQANLDQKLRMKQTRKWSKYNAAIHAILQCFRISRTTDSSELLQVAAVFQLVNLETF